MEQLMACGAVILLQLILYLVIGNDLCRWMGWEDRGILALGVGFFGYFGLFQLFGPLQASPISWSLFLFKEK